jgi:hypothetical protein
VDENPSRRPVRSVNDRVGLRDALRLIRQHHQETASPLRNAWIQYKLRPLSARADLSRLATIFRSRHEFIHRHEPLYHPVTSTLASRCGLFPVCTRLRACRSGLGTGQSFGQKSYLAGVVRFVFANVEPFPIDVYLVAAGELLCIGG